MPSQPAGPPTPPDTHPARGRAYEPLYEPSGRRLDPDDPGIGRRLTRLRELGLGGADPELDEHARRLAAAAQQISGTEQPPFAMINFVVDVQRLAGLYTPPDPTQPGGRVELSREVPRDHGYCPHTVLRDLPLVLEDVYDFPRYGGNPVVDKLGIRTYVGARLTDSNGLVLGTICIVDRDPHQWGQSGLDLIKDHAADLNQWIHQRERLATEPETRPS